MHAPYRKHDRQVTQIACLACGDARIVASPAKLDPGRCGRCGYPGWTYAEELDGSTTRGLLDTAAAPRTAVRPKHRRQA
jgi:ribosomal protein S27AE